MMAFPGKVADRLRAWRRDHGVARSELANRLGVSEKTVRGWEHGEHRPTGEHRERLEEVLESLDPAKDE